MHFSTPLHHRARKLSMPTKTLNPKHLHPPWPLSGTQNCQLLSFLKCTSGFRNFTNSWFSSYLLGCSFAVSALFILPLNVKFSQGSVLDGLLVSLFKTLPVGNCIHDFNYDLCHPQVYIFNSEIYFPLQIHIPNCLLYVLQIHIQNWNLFLSHTYFFCLPNLHAPHLISSSWNLYLHHFLYQVN